MEPRERQPLLRAGPPRYLVAIVLALVTGVGVVVGFGLSAFHVTSLPLACALLMTACVPLAARVIVDGRWAGGLRRWPERVAVALLVVLAGTLAAAAAVNAGEALFDRDRLVSGPLDGPIWLGLCAVALFGGLALLASVPLPWSLPRRRGALALAAGGGAVVLCGIAAGGVVAGPPTCDGFRLDSDRWRAALRAADPGEGERVAMATAFVRCETLDGMSPRQVRAALGRPDFHEPRDRSWSWQVGWIDRLGLGDGNTLTVSFRDGRAVETTLASDEYVD